jgi:hypothetical protein
VAAHQASYGAVLADLGLTDEAADKLLSTFYGPGLTHANEPGVTVAPSPVHGLGVLAQVHLFPGRRMHAGRFSVIDRRVNHGMNANIELQLIQGALYWVTTRAIRQDEELLADYQRVLQVAMGVCAHDLLPAPAVPPSPPAPASDASPAVEASPLAAAEAHEPDVAEVLPAVDAAAPAAADAPAPTITPKRKPDTRRRDRRDYMKTYNATRRLTADTTP